MCTYTDIHVNHRLSFLCWQHFISVCCVSSGLDQVEIQARISESLSIYSDLNALTDLAVETWCHKNFNLPFYVAAVD